MMRLELVVICTIAFNYILVNSEVEPTPPYRLSSITLCFNIIKFLTRNQMTGVVPNSSILQEQQCTSNRRFPWMPFGFEYPSGVLRLNTEIEQFYEYMQPTSIERALRTRVAARIDSVVQQVWPDAQAKAFGSFPIGLALPNSDIDLMIIGASGQSPMRLLAAKILASGIAEPDSLKVKDYLRIPLIEFIDRESKINVDMPIHNEPTLKVDTLFNEFQRKYPVLWKLMFVLKQYIKQRDLNDVFTGGISSFALTLMCISFLQKHPTYKPNEDANLGELLIDFFELYGERFDFEHFGISIKNGGEYLPRNVMPCNGDQQLFCVEDPVNHWLNACSLTYRAPDIKQAFHEAHSTLTRSISGSVNFTNNCSQNSILGHIVYVSQDFIKYRKWVQDTFKHTMKNGENVNSQILTGPVNSINGKSNIKSEL